VSQDVNILLTTANVKQVLITISCYDIILYRC